MASSQDNPSGGFTVKKVVLLALGWILLVIGPIIGLLPGPGGIPITVAGLALILSQSYTARRLFVRWQQRHPRVLGPLRRLMARRRGKRGAGGKTADR